MAPTLHFFLPLFFGLYFLAAFVVPIVRTYRATGINPVTFSMEDNAHNYIGRCFLVLMALITVCIVFYCMGNRYYQCLLPITYIDIPYLPETGIALGLLSLVFTVVAQVQMSKSWRIGIDENHKTDLVQTGLFRYTRNPIYLGLIVTLFGFFLMLPNAITLLVLVTGYILIQIQVRLEEEFMEQQHGQQFLDFKNKVRRWL